jgi:hypothetical protein
VASTKSLLHTLREAPNLAYVAKAIGRAIVGDRVAGEILSPKPLAEKKLIVVVFAEGADVQMLLCRYNN